MTLTRRFPSHLALMGETEGIVDDEEEGEDVPTRVGQSKHAPEIMRLWAEGATLTRISQQVRAATRIVRQVLLAHGVPEAEIEARLIRRRKADKPAPAEDPRITDFDPVSEDDEGRDEPAPMPAATIPWRELVKGFCCESCIHHHVCGRVKIVAERPWILCRDWERRAS